MHTFYSYIFIQIYLTQIISSENLIEVEASESDYHAEIQNNLPHKKRFRKRESAPAPMRSIHPKCYKCKQCGEQFNSQSAFTVINFYILIFLIK